MWDIQKWTQPSAGSPLLPGWAQAPWSGHSQPQPGVPLQSPQCPSSTVPSSPTFPGRQTGSPRSIARMGRAGQWSWGTASQFQHRLFGSLLLTGTERLQDGQGILEKGASLPSTERGSRGTAREREQGCFSVILSWSCTPCSECGALTPRHPPAQHSPPVVWWGLSPCDALLQLQGTRQRWEVRVALCCLRPVLLWASLSWDSGFHCP